MKNSNAGQTVSELVKEVLNTISQPYSENVTDRVCLAIQKDNNWRSRYNHLVDEHGKRSVNCQLDAQLFNELA